MKFLLLLGVSGFFCSIMLAQKAEEKQKDTPSDSVTPQIELEDREIAGAN